jgi:ribose transport system permease protein
LLGIRHQLVRAAGPRGNELSDVVGKPRVGRITRTARSLHLGSLASNLLFSSRFVTIWLATGVLLLVCQIVAPSTLSSVSLSSLLPLGSVVALAAIGQMLVVMVGGIDLSMAASISLLANVLVGVSQGRDDRFAYAAFVVLVWAVVIGLAHGLLVAAFGLNPIIVTLATGLILLGVTAEYRIGIANNASVPDVLSNFVFDKFAGVSKLFWFVLLLMLAVSMLLRSSSAGRRFQSVGANRRAARMAGIRVRSCVVFAYVAAAVAAGLAGVFVGGIVVNPGVNPGAPYLFGPIAAVVLGGAALTGGIASPTSTWVAAFFVTVLNQMLRVLGLSVASQGVVFGVAIILGMVISGDRIADVVGRLLLRPRIRDLVTQEQPTSDLAMVGTNPTGE